MVKRKHRRSKRKRSSKNKIWWWVGAVLVLLTVILIVDLKPWRKKHAKVSDQWPFRDMTKGNYVLSILRLQRVVL